MLNTGSWRRILAFACARSGLARRCAVVPNTEARADDFLVPPGSRRALPRPGSHSSDWSQARCARFASEGGPAPFARSLDRERVAVARLSATRLGDHLCQHSAQVANHINSVAPSLLALLHERRTSRPPQRGQTSPMAVEITSRSRTDRPFQWSDF